MQKDCPSVFFGTVAGHHEAHCFRNRQYVTQSHISANFEKVSFCVFDFEEFLSFADAFSAGQLANANVFKFMDNVRHDRILQVKVWEWKLNCFYSY